MCLSVIGGDSCGGRQLCRDQPGQQKEIPTGQRVEANPTGYVEAVLIGWLQDVFKGGEGRAPRGVLQAVPCSVLGSVLLVETHVRAVRHVPVAMHLDKLAMRLR